MTSEEGQTCRWKCEPQVKGAIWRIFCVSDEFFTPSEHSAIVATGILNALEAQVASLQQWAQQVHDALDGKPLPEASDEAPARIATLQQQVRDAEAKAALADDAYEFVETHEGGNSSGARAMLQRAREWCERYDALTPDTDSPCRGSADGNPRNCASQGCINANQCLHPDTGSEEGNDGTRSD